MYVIIKILHVRGRVLTMSSSEQLVTNVLLFYCGDMSWKCCQSVAGAKVVSVPACDCSIQDTVFMAVYPLSALASLPATPEGPTLVSTTNDLGKDSTKDCQSSE